MSFSRRLDEMHQPHSSPADRLRQAVELYDEGLALQRLKLRRQNPEASECDIDARIQKWLLREDET